MHCKQFKVSVQFVQVYMENVHDLLGEVGAEGANCKLREDKVHGVYVEGAQSVATPTAALCLDTLSNASKNLKFAATKMNRQSSRSHAVCRLFVEVHHSENEVHHGADSGELVHTASGRRIALPRKGGVYTLPMFFLVKDDAQQQPLPQLSDAGAPAAAGFARQGP